MKRIVHFTKYFKSYLLYLKCKRNYHYLHLYNINFLYTQYKYYITRWKFRVKWNTLSQQKWFRIYVYALLHTYEYNMRYHILWYNIMPASNFWLSLIPFFFVHCGIDWSHILVERERIFHWYSTCCILSVWNVNVDR